MFRISSIKIKMFLFLLFIPIIILNIFYKDFTIYSIFPLFLLVTVVFNCFYSLRMLNIIKDGKFIIYSFNEEEKANAQKNVRIAKNFLLSNYFYGIGFLVWLIGQQIYTTINFAFVLFLGITSAFAIKNDADNYTKFKLEIAQRITRKENHK